MYTIMIQVDESTKEAAAEALKEIARQILQEGKTMSGVDGWSTSKPWAPHKWFYCSERDNIREGDGK